MVTISPSLLSANFLRLEDEINALHTIASSADKSSLWLHLDIMDGHYVPNLTFGTPILSSLADFCKIPLDAHLMVTNPLFHVEAMKEFKIHHLTFHFESTVHHDSLIHTIKNYYPSCGLSLNPSTNISVIPDYVLKLIDLVLIMSVNPGFGGQKFIPNTLAKIAELRERKERLKLNFQIQVDGGVDNTNAKALIDSGANNLVAGSYIFSKGKGQVSRDVIYKERIEKLRNPKA